MTEEIKRMQLQLRNDINELYNQLHEVRNLKKRKYEEIQELMNELNHNNKKININI